MRMNMMMNNDDGCYDCYGNCYDYSGYGFSYSTLRDTFKMYPHMLTKLVLLRSLIYSYCCCHHC